MTEALATYVACHNDGVRTGSFAALVQLLSHDAALYFDGLSIGPFLGRDAIRTAFATRPPDDELVLFSVRGTAEGECADYAWKSAPAQVAGIIELRLRGSLICEVRISVRSLL